MTQEIPRKSPGDLLKISENLRGVFRKFSENLLEGLYKDRDPEKTFSRALISYDLRGQITHIKHWESIL